MYKGLGCNALVVIGLGITEEIAIAVPWGIVAAKVFGDRSGPPVLCIHGWLDNCNSFDTLIPLLSKGNYQLAFSRSISTEHRLSGCEDICGAYTT